VEPEVEDRGEIGREILVTSLVVSLADLSNGAISSTFSLYADRLGASLTLIGFLASCVGLSRTVTGAPTGMVSDRIGRKRFLILGAALFSVAPFFFAITRDPFLLVPIRLLMGFAMVSTFPVGLTYVGELADPVGRGRAIGLCSASMGVGFSTGLYLGGYIAGSLGYEVNFLTASLEGLVAAIIAWRGLKGFRVSGHRQAQRGLLSGFKSLLVNPKIMAAGMAGFFVSLVYSEVLNFFPLYAASVGLSLGVIGAIFAVRTFVSTGVRLPTGLLASRFGSIRFLILSLTLCAAVMFVIPMSSSAYLLTLLLAVEGVGFGIYLTSSSTYVVEVSQSHERGAAMGVSGTFSSLGDTISAFVLGVFADFFGLPSTFVLASALAILGALTVGILSRRGPKTPAF